MIEHQEHFGKKFYKDKKTGYWISSNCPKIRAHRWVWINHHGSIPKGYHIHHRNEDKSDNRIENLELIHGIRHVSYHMSTPERKEFSRNQANRVRHLTKKWHASEEGKAWHSYHAIKNNFGNWEPQKFKCELCGKEFLSKKLSNTKFCSNNCKSKSRRLSGIDDIIKKCLICEKEFKSNKYQKTKTCSPSCRAKLGYQISIQDKE